MHVILLIMSRLEYQSDRDTSISIGYISSSLNKGPRRQIEKIRYKGLIRRADALDRRIERSATVQTFFHTLFRFTLTHIMDWPGGSNY